MRRPRLRFSGMISVAALAALPSVGRAQAYGPSAQVVTIGAADFRSTSQSGQFIGPDGYLYSETSLAPLAEAPTIFEYVAPLSLPEGSRIDKLCLWAYDAQPHGDVGAGLLAVKLTPGGEYPREKSLGVYVASTSDFAYRVYCADLSETVRGKIDVDGDGVLDSTAYYVKAVLSYREKIGLGAIQITWRRQVSAPPELPTFGDVPSSDPGFDDVEALVASGITAGCAGGNYCPEANLTRRQMAIFLAKAFGLHWAD